MENIEELYSIDETSEIKDKTIDKKMKKVRLELSYE